MPRPAQRAKNEKSTTNDARHQGPAWRIRLDLSLNDDEDNNENVVDRMWTAAAVPSSIAERGKGNLGLMKL
jgi:hypothetical protein